MPVTNIGKISRRRRYTRIKLLEELEAAYVSLNSNGRHDDYLYRIRKELDELRLQEKYND